MSDLSSLKIDKSPIIKEKQVHSPIIWIVLGVVLAISILLIFLFSGAFSKSVFVSTALVQYSSGKSSQSARGLTASGYVVPQRKASIASKATGRLVWLGVKEGDKVEAGQLIARIEDSDVSARAMQFKASLLSAQSRLIEDEANLELAASEFKRQEMMFKEGATSIFSLEQVKNRLNVANAKVASAKADVQASEANLRAAQVEFQNTRIVAPFSGTILSKGADLGEVVSPISGSAQSKGFVVTIADMTTLEVEADVSEANIAKISVDQPCIITLDAYPAVQFEGKVSAIVPTANRNKATILTKIKFNSLDQRVLPEMSAKAIFLEQSSTNAQSDTLSRLSIPLDALTTFDGKRGVFKAEGSKARFIDVQTGISFGNLIEVKSGLSVRDAVIVSPPKDLKDGQSISTEKK